VAERVASFPHRARFIGLAGDVINPNARIPPSDGETALRPRPVDQREEIGLQGDLKTSLDFKGAGQNSRSLPYDFHY